MSTGAGKNSLTPGDVLEILLPDDRLGYIVYLGRHPEFGGCVLVSPRPHEVPAGGAFGAVFNDGYVAFCPTHLALRYGLGRVVAHIDRPMDVPSRVLRYGAGSTWSIQDADGNVEITSQLSDLERMLPIAEVLNHEALVSAIAEGWRPARGRPRWADSSRSGRGDGVTGTATHGAPDYGAVRSPDGLAVRVLQEQSLSDSERLVVHYLYFPTLVAARRAARALRREGFEVNVRLGADDENWLALARHRIVLSEEVMTDLRARMEDLAGRGRGEYDGWQAEASEE